MPASFIVRLIMAGSGGCFLPRPSRWGNGHPFRTTLQALAPFLAAHLLKPVYATLRPPLAHRHGFFWHLARASNSVAFIVAAYHQRNKLLVMFLLTSPGTLSAHPAQLGQSAIGNGDAFFL